jgi:hypothetical protein
LEKTRRGRQKVRERLSESKRESDCRTE